ncbi:potassium transport protein 1 [Decorospora gaudefroyi]|uniref:Potassium transport protein 1 n=1 Tax=Decorospora gaudefroyi TaxID=184978 RepID=A0A6A5KIZ4_9PLEO|nr:potassium transport protein 1 [Decorospora gaudefroyi]
MRSSWLRLDDEDVPAPIYELQHPRQAKDNFVKYLKEEVFRLNFYRAHMLYFIAVITLSSVIVYVQGVVNGPKEIGGAHLTYVNALFLCCSAMTTTGLNVVNLGDLSTFQQATFAVLMMIGNIPFVSTAVVLIRRSYFRRKMADVVKHSHTMQRVVRDIEDTRQSDRDGGSNSSGSLRQRPRTGQHQSSKGKQVQTTVSPKPQPRPKRRSYHHETGFGFLPAPWESRSARDFFNHLLDKFATELKPEQHDYVSFKPHLDSRGRFRQLSEQDRMELGGVEYRALQALLVILIGYQIFWYLVGIILILPYAYRSNIKALLSQVQPGGVRPASWAIFATVTEFTNGGLNIVNANFIPFSGHHYILLAAAVVALAGQTQFPIFLRTIIWAMKKLCPKGSRFRNTLDFLLQHPRRCFIYLFPIRETLHLFALQFVIDMAAWLCFEILNMGMPSVDALPTGTRIMDGLFQAVGLRTSGAHIIGMNSLAPACLVAYLVIMYISIYPMALTLRKTNTYEEKSIGLEDVDTSASGVASHLQRQLTYDIWFQVFAFFLVCCIERGHIVREDPGFNIFSILFEVTSAYGTVGQSLGVPGKTYSLCGDFASLSKVVLLFVMVRGRHRGLPLAIDRSILLPGEELMHRIDKEYNAKGTEDPEEENELRNDIESSGETQCKAGKGGDQDPEDRKKSQPNNKSGREEPETIAESNP